MRQLIKIKMPDALASNLTALPQNAEGVNSSFILIGSRVRSPRAAMAVRWPLAFEAIRPRIGGGGVNRFLAFAGRTRKTLDSAIFGDTPVGTPNGLMSAFDPLRTSCLLTFAFHFYYSRNVEMESAVVALSALAQGTRLRIYRLLVEAGPNGIPAGKIGEELDLPATTLSFHLAHLARAGLARSRQEGRFVIYSADFQSMKALIGYLTENCCGRRSCAPAAKPMGKARQRAA